MHAEAAVADAFNAGRALCKFISRNDVGATGAHQSGFYLPKAAWQMFSVQPPVKGVNHKAMVRIRWPENLTTRSAVTWYGKGTRSEYRLTRFGRGFPWLRETVVGSLLVIVPFTLQEFSAYVLETDADIELFQAALGVETFGDWAVFDSGNARFETEDQCLERVFLSSIATLEEFPAGVWMAESARNGLEKCLRGLARLDPDALLLKSVAAEYQLFRAVERKLCLPAIRRQFDQIDEFVNVAATIMNRRKARAGHSFEYHVEHLLRGAGLEFERQPKIDGKVRPDLLFPSKAAYEDPNFPVSRLVVAGLKTTCKDRWRQILNEGKRVPEKHLLTLQEAISKDQLIEMRDANVTLVVPKLFHAGYDPDSGIRLLSVEEFFGKVRSLAVAQ